MPQGSGGCKTFLFNIKVVKVWVPLMCSQFPGLHNSGWYSIQNFNLSLYRSIPGISRVACVKCLFYSVLMHATGSLGISALAHVRSFPSGSI